MISAGWQLEEVDFTALPDDLAAGLRLVLGR